MLLFDRGSAGQFYEDAPSLAERAEAQSSELEKYLVELSPERRAQTDPPFVWKRPFERDVLARLYELSHEKCNFCEQKLPLDALSVHLFRPPSRASDGIDDTVNDAYIWLASNVNNMFLICKDCRPLSRSYFPVRNTRWRPKDDRMLDYLAYAFEPIRTREAPVLIYPGELRKNLRFHEMDLTGVLPLVVPTNGDQASHLMRWQETIRHFSLNRPDLVAARKKAITERIKVIDRGRFLRAGESFEGLEFASTFYVLFSIIHSAHKGRPLNRLLSYDRLTAELEEQIKEDRFLETVIKALNSLADGETEVFPSALLPAPQVDPVSQYRRDFPRLTGVSIRNYKSLEHVDLALKAELTEVDQHGFRSPEVSSPPEAPCLLILGENATGKSSILEALVLACLQHNEREALGVDAQRLTLNPDYLGELDSDPRAKADVELTFADDTTLKLSIDREKAKLNASAEDKRPLVFGFGAHRLYGSKGAVSDISRIETLFYPERAIPNPEIWLTKLYQDSPGQIDDVISALRYLIEIDDEFESISPVTSVKTGELRWLINFQRKREISTTDPDTGTVHVSQKPYTIAQRFDTVSSGYRAVLALVCEVLSGLHEAFPGSIYDARHARAIVVVDEIEAHLHPRWKLTIIDRLRRALPNVTFIFTSHDPLCVRGTVQGEVVVLNRYVTDGAEGTLPEMVECVPIGERAEHLTVEQMLNSDLFRLLTTEGDATRTNFAEVADILAKQERGEGLVTHETQLLAEFNSEIKDALPYGDTVIPTLVQEAVAEFVQEARDRSSKTQKEKRRAAVDSLKAFLAGTLP